MSASDPKRALTSQIGGATMPKLRMHRIAIFSAAIATLVAIGIATPVAIREYRMYCRERAEQPSPDPASAHDQREILRVVLGERRGLLLPPGDDMLVMLLNRTTPICEGCPTPPSIDSISSSYLDNEIPRKLRLELIKANGPPAKAVPRLDLPWVIDSPYASIGDALQATGGWSVFHDRKPTSAGFIAPSRAVISSDGQHALVYVGHFAGDLAGRGFLHLLVREGGTWRVQKSVGIWVS